MFLMKRRCGGRESEVGMEGLAPRVRASYGSLAARCGYEGVGNFFLWIAGNPLKSPDSDEGIQENPRESKPFFLGFSWSGLGLAGKDLA
jgi:hypothetical protein